MPTKLTPERARTLRGRSYVILGFGVVFTAASGYGCYVFRDWSLLIYAGLGVALIALAFWQLRYVASQSAGESCPSCGAQVDQASGACPRCPPPPLAG